MKQQLFAEGFLDYLCNKYNENVEDLMVEKCLNTKIKTRELFPVTFEKGKEPKEGIFIPPYLKRFILENGDIYEQEIVISCEDIDEVSYVDIRYTKKEKTEDKGE